MRKNPANKAKKRLVETDYILKEMCKVKNWYHQIELAPGIVTPGVNNSAKVLKLLNLPKNCRGLKVLDLGTRDGYFAFELEKRGAKVIAVDYIPANTTGFEISKKILNSKTVEYKQDNIYNVTPKKYGRFDIVLFLGLLYHLPDPIRALNIVRSVCKNKMYVETQGIDNSFLLPNGSFATLKSIASILSNIPIMQFYPKNTLNHDPSNYWAPNLTCLVGMLEETNFKIINKQINGSRLIVECTIAYDLKTKEILDMATGNKTPNSW